MSDFTPQQAAKLTEYLATHTIAKGMGTAESACSVSAINLAIDGRLTDDIPPCMSLVIGRWIIIIQDAMPAEMRNSAEWKRLLPLAAGTGRAHEAACLDVAADWLWGTILPQLQPLADDGGFGAEWLRMTTDRTRGAADAAAAVSAAYTVFAYAAAAARARAAAYAAAVVADAYAFADAADAAAAAARAAAAAGAPFRETINPTACLARMIGVTQ